MVSGHCGLFNNITIFMARNTAHGEAEIASAI